MLRESLVGYSAAFVEYLTQLGLPTAGVVTGVEERRRLLILVPDAIERLPPERRGEAMYLSKFLSAIGGGLFDAALNYLWNETVANLRQKVVHFDLQYFLDSAVDPSRRRSIQSEDDLERLEDWELIRGCRDIGIVSDLGYRHLDYVRNMRNHASAAHPNHADLTAIQLAAMLESCIREVLSTMPHGPMLQVKSLLYNLRQQVLGPEHVANLPELWASFPGRLLGATLRAVFGMYTDPATESDVRTNIARVAPSLWAVVHDDERTEVGVKYATFKVNADVRRQELAREFLVVVEGLSYLPEEQLVGEINAALDRLYAAHIGWDNFHNEDPHAAILAGIVPRNREVPRSIMRKFVKVLVLCRTGNGYGVAWSARPHYDDMIRRFSAREQAIVLAAPTDADVSSRLSLSGCQRHYREVLALMTIADGRLELVAKLLGTADLASVRTNQAYLSALRSAGISSFV